MTAPGGATLGLAHPSARRYTKHYAQTRVSDARMAMILHMVLFRLRDEVAPEAWQELERDRSWADAIPGITALWTGPLAPNRSSRLHTRICRTTDRERSTREIRQRSRSHRVRSRCHRSARREAAGSGPRGIGPGGCLMRALVLRGPRDVCVEDRPLPRPPTVGSEEENR